MSDRQLKIIVLLDSQHISAWVRIILDGIAGSEGMKLLAVVTGPDRKSRGGRFISKAFYRLFRKLDRKLFGMHPDAFLQSSWMPADVRVIRAAVSTKGVRTEPDRATMEAISMLKPDLILRFGMGILTGEILRIAAFGIWSLHHDDNRKYRGGPPGFWEWFFKDPVTGVTLQQLNEKLDGGWVIARSAIPTDFTSFARNQNKIFWTGSVLMLRCLDRLATTRDVAYETGDQQFYSNRLFRDPDIIRSIAAFGKLAWRWIGRRQIFRPSRRQWNLWITNRWPQWELRKFRRIKPPDDRFWADPCLVKSNGRYFLFLEEFNFGSGRGHIACVEMDASGKMKGQPQAVLREENHHFSYPFVFEDQGTWFMIPESSDQRAVYLYECILFPAQWKIRSILFKDVEAFDSTVQFYGGKWWLFQTEKGHPGMSANSELFLYSALTPDGPWIPHPQNPVVADPQRARPAGRLFESNGNWYRPSQNCTPHYGYGIRINRIVAWTETVYAEESVSEITPHWVPGLTSNHSLTFKDQLAIVDGQLK